MDDGQSIWSLAAMIVEKHGVRATSFAELQVLKARHRGDAVSMQRWQNVVAAAASILEGKDFDLSA